MFAAWDARAAGIAAACRNKWQQQGDVKEGVEVRAIMVASMCCTCPYLGLLLANLPSLFFSFISVILRG
jgi:hypothetical protein